jgi:uncharacterized protein
MANPVVHFEIMGKDGPALRKFYSDLFGWDAKTIDGDMDYGMVSAGDDGGIGGGIGTTAEGGPSYSTFYVSVDDVKSSLEKAESLGGQRMMGPMEVPGGGEIAIFKDPEGSMIGLFHRTEQS